MYIRTGAYLFRVRVWCYVLYMTTMMYYRFLINYKNTKFYFAIPSIYFILLFLVSRAEIITILFEWVLFCCCGGLVMVGFQNPKKLSWLVLDSVCPVSISNKKHAYSDKGGNIIHAYVWLLLTWLQQPDRNSYK